MAKQSAQKGIIFIPLFFIFVVIGVVSYVIGVQSGYLKFFDAPTTPGSITGPFDREPVKRTPIPTLQPDRISYQNDTPKPSLAPQVAQKKLEGKWQGYTSSKYGYSVSYPIDWELLDGNTETSRRMLIKDNANLGYVDIQSFFDKTLGEPGKLQEALNAMEVKFRSDADLKVTQFKSSVDGKIGGYITTGEQILRGELYNYENRGLLANNGKILLFHGAYKKTAPKDYLQKIEKIITSFKID